MTTHQGYKNQATWLASLEIISNHELHLEIKDQVESIWTEMLRDNAIKDACEEDLVKIGRIRLAHKMYVYFTNKLSIGHIGTFERTMATAAIDSIDFVAVASEFIVQR